VKNDAEKQAKKMPLPLLRPRRRGWLEHP